MGYILILGAKSDIAKATARLYAEKGYDLYLTARNVKELESLAYDIHIRTQRDVKCVELDILNFASHSTFYKSLSEEPLGIISAIGYLGDQAKAQIDFNEAQKIMETNYSGLVSLLNIIAESFVKRKSGFIIGISSVAGDRGRKSNFLYGSAKAALTTYLSGLRNRLYDSGVHVMTVKPGFVDTNMTKDMDLPKLLTAQPEEVAKDIYKAQKKDTNVIYTKWIWRWIMLVIRMIPEFIFKKLSL